MSNLLDRLLQRGREQVGSLHPCLPSSFEGEAPGEARVSDAADTDPMQGGDDAPPAPPPGQMEIKPSSIPPPVKIQAMHEPSLRLAPASGGPTAGTPARDRRSNTEIEEQRRPVQGQSGSEENGAERHAARLVPRAPADMVAAPPSLPKAPSTAIFSDRISAGDSEVRPGSPPSDRSPDANLADESSQPTLSPVPPPLPSRPELRETSPPSVDVRIGRIEVHAPPAPMASRTPRAPAGRRTPRVSLDAYLTRRREG
jgi:hypothetical protein